MAIERAPTRVSPVDRVTPNEIEVEKALGLEGRHQVEEGKRRHRLATPRFADQAGGDSGREIE